MSSFVDNRVSIWHLQFRTFQCILDDTASIAYSIGQLNSASAFLLKLKTESAVGRSKRRWESNPLRPSCSRMFLRQAARRWATSAFLKEWSTGELNPNFLRAKQTSSRWTSTP